MALAGDYKPNFDQNRINTLFNIAVFCLRFLFNSNYFVENDISYFQQSNSFSTKKYILLYSFARPPENY